MSHATSLVECQVRERRQRILAEARRYVATHGVEGLNVRALAKGCGISVPTIYRTFGSKDGLLCEAMQPLAERSMVVPGSPDAGWVGYARLLSLFDLWSLGPAASADDESAFIRAFLASDSGRKLAFRVARRLCDETQQVLCDMQTRSELLPWVDPAALAARISGQSIVASIECASGAGDADAFRAAFVYACCLLMVGATGGSAQEAFREAAQAAQARTLRRPT